MSFSLEKDMYATALENVPDCLDISIPYAQVIEFSLSYRRADIGFAPIARNAENTRFTESLVNLKSRELWELALIISEDICLSGKLTNEILEQLERCGLIDFIDEKIVLDNLDVYIGPLTIIELKLKKWSDALNQARFYQKYADYSCVVLDGEIVDSVPLEPFKKEGIGFLAAWPDNLEVIVKPRESTIINIYRKNYYRLKVLQDISRNSPQKWKLIS